MLLQTAHCPPTLGKPWRRGLAYRRKAGRWCPEQLGRPTPLAADMDMCLLLALACFCVRSQVTYLCCLACRRNLVRWALLFDAAGTDGPYRTTISPRHPNRRLPTEALVAAVETGHTKAICQGVAGTPRYSRLASTTSTARSLLQRKHCRSWLGAIACLASEPKLSAPCSEELEHERALRERAKMAGSEELQHSGLAQEVGEHDDPPPAAAGSPLRMLASRAHQLGRDARTPALCRWRLWVVNEYGLFFSNDSTQIKVTRIRSEEKTCQKVGQRRSQRRHGSLRLRIEL